ncbi:MAG: Protein DsrB [Sodalis sp. Psp]|nr:Protein DsrB [Sodalis sp. Psp]MCR3756913.1 Protein DsrB [Sodalis sp. Ppy]
MKKKVMELHDRVIIKTDGGPCRPGTILAIEEFSEGVMYLVSLDDYPIGIWFFNNSVSSLDYISVASLVSEGKTK